VGVVSQQCQDVVLASLKYSQTYSHGPALAAITLGITQTKYIKQET
jgi:hypothetical protein